MQQTEKLKLNLIETGDPISPAPLNENAQKLETALAAHEAAVKKETAFLAGKADGLEQRIIQLEQLKIAYGTYQGTGAEQHINLGFAPKVVMASGYVTYILFQGQTLHTSNGIGAYTTETGFFLTNAASNNYNLGQYHFVAFG